MLESWFQTPCIYVWPVCLKNDNHNHNNVVLIKLHAFIDKLHKFLRRSEIKKKKTTKFNQTSSLANQVTSRIEFSQNRKEEEKQMD